VALVNVKPTTLDVKLANTIARHTNRKTERAAEILTWGADEKLLFAAAGLVWLWGRGSSRRARRLSDHVFICTVAAAILPHVMKGLVDQERPDRRMIRAHARGVPFSGKKYDAFPSGHAVHIGALASAATLLPPPWRNGIWIAGAMLASTRIVLLAHWLTDVVAGLAIGGALERLLRPFTMAQSGRRRRALARPGRARQSSCNRTLT
jgi:membrane-associated phospholipid phosphatase